MPCVMQIRLNKWLDEVELRCLYVYQNKNSTYATLGDIRTDQFRLA